MLCLCAPSARAQAAPSDSPGTALLVRVPGDERVMSPLRAELNAHRFQILELSERTIGRTKPLAELALRYDAQAALRSLADASAVELWIAARDASGQPSIEVVRASGSASTDLALLALRVAEVMRARGLKLAPPPSAAPRPPGQPVPAPPAEPAPSPLPAAGAPARRSERAPDAAAQPSEPSAVEPSTRPPETLEDAAAVRAQPPAQQPSPRPQPTPEESTEHAAPARPKPPAVTPAAPASEREAETATPEASESEQPDAEPEPEAEEPPATQSERRAAAARLLHIAVAATGSFTFAKHALDPSWDLLAQVRLQPFDLLSLSAVALLPIAKSTLENDIGAADMHIYLIGGFADIHANTRWPQFTWHAGLGGASVLAWAKGTRATDGFDPKDSHVRIAAGLARVGASWAATPEVRLVAQTWLGFALPKAFEVRFGSTQVGSWGRPLLLLTLGIEFGLPWRR